MPVFLSTFFFISFLLTLELFKITELLATRDISVLFVLGLLGDMALSFVPLTMPIAVFFSTIFCLNRISNDSEFIAMRAAGLTKSRIFIPFFIIATILSFSVYQLNQTIIPRSNFEFRKKIIYLTSSGVLAGVKGGQFFTMVPTVTLFADKSTRFGRKLEGVFLHLKEKPDQEKVIFAERGELTLKRDSESMIENLTLTLYDGNIIGQAKGVELEKILFNKYIFPFSQNQFDDTVKIKETMMSSKELLKVMKMVPAEAEKKFSFTKKDLFNIRYEYWNRINGAVICLIFCFLGYGLGVTGNRGKSKNSGALGLVALLIYYGLYFSLVSVTKRGVIPVPVGVFFPITFIMGISIYYYRKLDWQ
jgi:lipopolysaccharide export system permease protein